MEYDIPYTKYMEMREEMLLVSNTIYIENEASKIYTSKNDVPDLVESPQSPPPPPYQKVSPTVIQWQSKCMKANDPPGSNRSYRTIPPAMIYPNTLEELDKLIPPIHKASNRSTRSPISTYDTKVVDQH